MARRPGGEGARVQVLGARRGREVDAVDRARRKVEEEEDVNMSDGMNTVENIQSRMETLFSNIRETSIQKSAKDDLICGTACRNLLNHNRQPEAKT